MNFFILLLTLTLGCLAIAVPLLATTKKAIEGSYLYVLLSLGACAISIQVQAFQFLSALNQQNLNPEESAQLTSSLDKIIPLCGVIILATLLTNLYAITKKRAYFKQNPPKPQTPPEKPNPFPQDKQKKRNIF